MGEASRGVTLLGVEDAPYTFRVEYRGKNGMSTPPREKTATLQTCRNLGEEIWKPVHSRRARSTRRRF